MGQVHPMLSRTERAHLAEQARAYLEHWEPRRLNPVYVAELVKRMTALQHAVWRGENVLLEGATEEAEHDARFCFSQLD